MNVPPKTMAERLKTISKEPFPPADTTGESALAITARPSGSLAKPADSLPILQAFQEFLDAERRKAQVRMAALATFFILLFIGLLGGGLAVGSVFFRQFRADLADLQNRVSSAPDTPAASDIQARTLISQLDARSRTIQDALNQQEKILKEARTKLSSQGKAHEEQMSGVRAVVRALETQNNGLKADIASLKKKWPEAAHHVNLAVDTTQPTQVQHTKNIPDIEPLKTAAAPAISPAPEAESTPLPTHIATTHPQHPDPITPRQPPPNNYMLLMSIAPRGRDSAVAWRLSIPE